MSVPEERKLLVRECYRQCFDDKRHYDILSWTIGGSIFAASIFLLTEVTELASTYDDNTKALLSFIGLILVVIWAALYERNRLWGEVCNETSRNIERKIFLDGPSIAYMKFVKSKKIDLSNEYWDMEFNRVPYSYSIKNNIKKAKPRTVRMTAIPSAHYFIRALQSVIGMPFLYLLVL